MRIGEHSRRLAAGLLQPRRLRKLRRNRFPQPLIARQAQHVAHALLLAPRHQLLAAETRIGPHHNRHPGPPPPDLPDNPLHLFRRSRRRVLIRCPQPRTQQMLAGKNIQRQVALLVVIAVEKPALLPAVQGQIRHVQIQHDAVRRFLVSFQKHLHQQRVDRLLPAVDFLVSAWLLAAQLNPIQRALARQRRLARLALAARTAPAADPAAARRGR